MIRRARTIGAVRPFSARSAGGVLVSRDGDRAVQAALAALNAEREWRRYEITGGSSGIRVERRLSRFDSESFDEWANDLWLAGELARRLETTSAGTVRAAA